MNKEIRRRFIRTIGASGAKSFSRVAGKIQNDRVNLYIDEKNKEIIVGDYTTLDMHFFSRICNFQQCGLYSQGEYIYLQLNTNDLWTSYYICTKEELTHNMSEYEIRFCYHANYDYDISELKKFHIWQIWNLPIYTSKIYPIKNDIIHTNNVKLQFNFA